MTKAIRVYLPVAQTALAVLLMYFNWRRMPRSAGASLESQISFGINLPAVLLSSNLAKIWSANYAPWFFFTYIVYFVLVAVLWYAVAIEASGTGGSTLMGWLVPRGVFRGIADLLLVLLGLALLYGGSTDLVFGHLRGPELPIPIGLLLWGVSIASFYASDLYRCTTTRRAGGPGSPGGP